MSFPSYYITEEHIGKTAVVFVYYTYNHVEVRILLLQLKC